MGKDKEKYFPQQVVEYEYQNKRANDENVPINGQISITLGNSKIEKKKFQNYILKENIINKKTESSTISRKFGHPKSRFGSRPNSRYERRPFGGPRLNFPGSQRPRSGNIKKRTLPLSRKAEIPKGYIPFSGQGFRVGGNISKQKPMTKISVGYIQKPSENYQQYKGYSYRKIESIEKNKSYNNLFQSNISSVNNNLRNTRSLKNDYSLDNKRFIPLTNYRNTEFNSPRFPGKGTRVGTSGLVEKVGLDSGSGQGSSVSYSEYRKYEQTANQPGSYYIKKNNYHTEENIEYHKGHENIGMYKEVFCPVHGRQLIRYTEY